MENKSKPKQNNIKKWMGKLHLWLGLSVGLIVFIVSITGAMYVFKDEIENLTRKEYIYHNEVDISRKKTLPIRQLEELVMQQTKEKYPIHWVNIPLDKSQSYQFYWYEHTPDKWNYFDEFPIYKLAYVNPFTGKVLKVYDEKNSFFAIVKSIHWSFLLNHSWGKYVVGIPVLIFVFMLISGIVLWWPKSKNAVKQRTRFQWRKSTSWKRKNYDLHNILGFYSAIFALIFAITGLFYAFVIVQSTLYFTFSGGETEMPDFSHITTIDPVSMKNNSTLDIIMANTEKECPTAAMYSIDLGHEHLDDHEHENFSVYVKHLPYSYHKSSSLIFDENSGRMLHAHHDGDKNGGEKIVAANYDIHVGAIFGLPTKIIAFIVSLICASLPISGFLLWWGRKNKKTIHA